MLNFYQKLPEYLNPIAFSIGFFEVRWYSLMYLVGLLVVTLLLRWRVNKGETDLKWNDIFDFLMFSFLGLLIGGRLGYVFLYDWEYYGKNLFDIISPFDHSGTFIGISGMSYHGALAGITVASVLFCKKRKINFLKMIDFVIPAVSAGYFFGRVGNFLNGELYGRKTTSMLGMFFNNERFLRWPSQLIEALFEGAVLFVILWILRNKFSNKNGFFLGVYLIGYGVIRFFVEFLRQPDWQRGFIFGFLTVGQILSLLTILMGMVVFKKIL